MYNHEIKERFLQDVFSKTVKNSNSCYAIFDGLSVAEESSCKDVAVMSIEEVLSAIGKVNISKYATAASALSLIKKYVQWCAENKVFNISGKEFDEISVDHIDISESLSKLLFKDEDDFLTALRSVRPFDDGYLEVVVMVFSWVGIELSQIFDVKIPDVDLFDRVIYLNNGLKKISFSERVGEILTVYSRTRMAKRQNGTCLRDVYRDDSYNMFIRRFCPKSQLGRELTKPQIKAAVNQMNQDYIELGNTAKFTTRNVCMSGALRRVYELEQTGVDIFSIKNKSSVIEAYRASDKLYEILWLYRSYKRAFNL